MGCYSQLDSDALMKLDGVDIVIGTNNRRHIYELIEEYRLFHKQINKVVDSKNYTSFEELKLSRLHYHTRGFIKIQDGCENFCTFCAIPYSRGPIKSRDHESIIKEINELVESGVKEVVLAGINTGTYGKDLGNISLAKLIELILLNIPNLYRIRLSSIELMEVDDELLNVLEKYKDRIAHQIHIPLQSGCDSVLVRMNRKYLMDDFFKKVEIIRNIMPDVALTTDCLAGFVGETIDEFNTTYLNIKKIGFSECHIFPYSKRAGTKAFDMPNHLDPNIIKERAHKLQLLAKELKENFFMSYLGQIVEVLIEQKKDGYWVGHTTNYLEVGIKDDNIKENDILNVRLTQLMNGILIGEKIS